MNKKYKKWNYYYSVRTPGEVIAVFFRDNEVICKPILFIVQ